MSIYRFAIATLTALGMMALTAARADTYWTEGTHLLRLRRALDSFGNLLGVPGQRIALQPFPAHDRPTLHAVLEAVRGSDENEDNRGSSARGGWDLQ